MAVRGSEWNNIIYRVANKVAVRGSEWNNNIYRAANKVAVRGAVSGTILYIE